jgi:hypothetical protein
MPAKPTNHEEQNREIISRQISGGGLRTGSSVIARVPLLYAIFFDCQATFHRLLMEREPPRLVRFLIIIFDAIADEVRNYP